MTRSPDRLPFRFQVALHDCGPACVQALADFYGTPVTIDQLRGRLRTDPLRGTTIRAFSEGLADLFEVEVGRAPTGLVPSELLPFVAYLPRLRHYVTVWALNQRRGQVLLGDPAAGLTSVPIEDFLSDWDGIAVVLRPRLQRPVGLAERAAFVAERAGRPKPSERSSHVVTSVRRPADPAVGVVRFCLHQLVATRAP